MSVGRWVRACGPTHCRRWHASPGVVGAKESTETVEGCAPGLYPSDQRLRETSVCGSEALWLFMPVVRKPRTSMALMVGADAAGQPLRSNPAESCSGCKVEVGITSDALLDGVDAGDNTSLLRGFCYGAAAPVTAPPASSRGVRNHHSLNGEGAAQRRQRENKRDGARTGTRRRPEALKSSKTIKSVEGFFQRAFSATKCLPCVSANGRSPPRHQGVWHALSLPFVQSQERSIATTRRHLLVMPTTVLAVCRRPLWPPHSLSDAPCGDLVPRNVVVGIRAIDENICRYPHLHLSSSLVCLKTAVRACITLLMLLTFIHDLTLYLISSNKNQQKPIGSAQGCTVKKIAYSGDSCHILYNIIILYIRSSSLREATWAAAIAAAENEDAPASWKRGIRRGALCTGVYHSPVHSALC